MQNSFIRIHDIIVFKEKLVFIFPWVQRHEVALMRLTTAHCMYFGLVCLWPTTCSQADYVMWGGLNIMPSLLTQWVVVCSIVKKFQLHRQTPLHPVWIAGISGFVFWLGNMQMVVGKDAYVAAWMRATTEVSHAT